MTEEEYDGLIDAIHAGTERKYVDGLVAKAKAEVQARIALWIPVLPDEVSRSVIHAALTEE